jgi:DNA mismatch repair ATPase MutS
MTPTEALLWWSFFMPSQPKSPSTTNPERHFDGHGPSSVLFHKPRAPDVAGDAPAPEFFVDLNLDQLVEATTSQREEYDLKAFFHSPLRRVEAIRYRHEVFRDLQDSKLLDDIRQFTERMRDVRVHSKLSSKLYDRFHKEMWFVHAIEIYCEAVEKFAGDLARARLKSRGLLASREYLASYVENAGFAALRDEAKSIAAALSEIKYSILVREGSFTVQNFHDEADYSAEVEATFEKFKQGAVNEYLAKFNNAPQDMNHVEAKVLEFVARLNPEAFSRLSSYCARHADFLDKTIATFDREIQFYISYLDQVAKLERAGLQFCLPEISKGTKNVHCHDGFDMALALKLTGEGKPVVCNSFDLKGRERIIVISGPNPNFSPEPAKRLILLETAQ